jgi:hypothetical protein
MNADHLEAASHLGAAMDGCPAYSLGYYSLPYPGAALNESQMWAKLRGPFSFQLPSQLAARASVLRNKPSCYKPFVRVTR